MASPTVDLGTGIIIAFGTSGFTAEILGVTPYSAERESVETTHLTTAAAGASQIGGKTYIPADITDGGTMSISGHFNPDTVAPLESDAETITITYPLQSGNTIQAALSFSGFMTNYNPNEFVVNGKMEFTADIKISGPISRTVAS